MKDIETFDSFCEAWGQPIADFEITPHPARNIRDRSKFCANPDPLRVAVWKVSEECQGGIVVGCTWHDGPPHQWHANDGSRAAIAHLLSERDRLASELQAVRGELATARDALRGIWPFIEEDDGGFATPAYQKAINDVRAALAMTEGANP